MSNIINNQLPIQPQRLPDLGAPAPAGRPGAVGGQETSFKDLLVKSLEEVDQLQKDADVAFKRLVTGETQNVTEVFTAVEKAGLAFETLMQIRNKLVDAYNDIRQMRI